MILDQARNIAAEAAKAAEAKGKPVVVSVVDAHGNQVLLHRMDGAPLLSIDMAFRKAYTAMSFGATTESLMPKVQPGQPLYGLSASSGGRLVAFGGGAPAELPGGVKVGIGISGGTTDEDIEILNAVLSAVSGRA